MLEVSELTPGEFFDHWPETEGKTNVLLLANGFQQVFNLAGGIDAWSQEIDTDIPRY